MAPRKPADRKPKAGTSAPAAAQDGRRTPPPGTKSRMTVVLARDTADRYWFDRIDPKTGEQLWYDLPLAMDTDTTIMFSNIIEEMKLNSSTNPEDETEEDRKRQSAFGEKMLHFLRTLGGDDETNAVLGKLDPEQQIALMFDFFEAYSEKSGGALGAEDTEDASGK